MPAAYAGATTPAPPAPERRSRTGLWVGLGVGAGVIGVAVVVSLFILAWSGSSVGASSPAAALDGMVKALQNKDIASVLSGLAPGELTGVDELWRETQTKTAALGGDVPKATGDVIVFEPRTVKWDVEELSANTARATLSEVDMTVGFDAAVLGDVTAAQKDKLEGLGADRVDGTRYLWDVTTDDLPSDPVTVMTVKRDGGWFVSPLYTAGEYAYGSSRKAQRKGPPDYAYDPDKVTSGAGSPSDAVRALAAAAGAGTENDLVALLSPRQLAFAQVYHAFGDEQVSGSDVTIDGLVLDEEPIDEGRTRVRVKSVDVTWSTGKVEIDGSCWRAETEGRKGPRTREGCLADLLPAGSESLAHLLPDSLAVVAIEGDGRWYVDPLQSVTTIIGDVVNELEAGDVDQVQELARDLNEIDYDSASG